MLACGVRISCIPETYLHQATNTLQFLGRWLFLLTQINSPSVHSPNYPYRRELNICAMRYLTSAAMSGPSQIAI